MLIDSFGPFQSFLKQIVTKIDNFWSGCTFINFQNASNYASFFQGRYMGIAMSQQVANCR